MGVEARLQPSNPPEPLTGRTACVQLNHLNTIVIPHDLQDSNANTWAFSTNDPATQPRRSQRVGDNEVVYFVDGKETLPQFQCEIEQTNGENDFIYLVGWYLDVDLVFPDIVSKDGSKQAGKSMRTLLTEAGKRKVQIRVMLDGQTHNASTNEEAIHFVLWGGPPPPPEPNPPPRYELIDQGVKEPNPEYAAYMKAYMSKYGDQIAARQNAKQLRLNSPDRPDSAGLIDCNFAALGCHHQKILIVCHGRRLTAFCGGVDINADRISGAGGEPLHDVHCRIRGPAAWDLLQIFLDRWDDCVSRGGGPIADLDSLLTDKRALRGQKVTHQNPAGKFSVQIARTTGQMKITPYNFAPQGERSIRELLHTAIRQARRFIYIEDQYLVNLQVAGWLSLHLSHIRHLTILVPPSYLTVPYSYVKKRSEFINKLMEGGADKVRVFCHNASTDTCGLYIHAKTWIFDDKFAIIGSANCNNRGMTHDSEVAAGIFDPSSDEKLTYTFAHRLRIKLWAHHLGMDTPEGHAELADGVASADLWKEICRPPTAKIEDYHAPADVWQMQRKDAPETLLRGADNAVLGWAEDV